MKSVKRANKILQIPDDRLSDYLAKGFSEIDEKGKVINEGESNDVKTLKKQNKTLSNKVAALEAENEALKKENEELNKK